MAAAAIKDYASMIYSDTGTISAPSSTSIGDLILCFLWSQFTASTITHTANSGYTTVRTQLLNDGTACGRLTVGGKIATSAGTQTCVPYTITNATAGQTCISLTTFTGFDANRALSSYNSNSIADTSANPSDPPALTGNTGDILFFAMGALQINTSFNTIITAPANYNFIAGGPNSGTSHLTEFDIFYRTITGMNNATEDPPAITDNVTPNGSAAMTIAIPPFVPGHPTMRRWGGIPTMLAGNLIGRSW